MGGAMGRPQERRLRATWCLLGRFQQRNAAREGHVLAGLGGAAESWGAARRRRRSGWRCRSCTAREAGPHPLDERAALPEREAEGCCSSRPAIATRKAVVPERLLQNPCP